MPLSFTHRLSVALGLLALLIVLTTTRVAAQPSLYSIHQVAAKATPSPWSTICTAVNRHGQVVGMAASGEGGWQAFVWSAGAITYLGTLGGATSLAYAIDDAGVISGVSETGLGVLHGFLWHAGTMVDMGPLVGSASEVAELSRPVSSAALGDWVIRHRAFHSISSGLDHLDYIARLLPTDSRHRLDTVQAITDAGLIVGHSTLNGARHCFVMTPAPTRPLPIPVRSQPANGAWPLKVWAAVGAVLVAYTMSLLARRFTLTLAGPVASNRAQRLGAESTRPMNSIWSSNGPDLVIEVLDDMPDSLQTHIWSSPPIADPDTVSSTDNSIPAPSGRI
jgi:probable HAF family extracellular repeat protein